MVQIHGSQSSLWLLCPQQEALQRGETNAAMHNRDPSCRDISSFPWDSSLGPAGIVGRISLNPCFLGLLWGRGAGKESRVQR